jgi:cytoskeleton protein RodZ
LPVTPPRVSPAASTALPAPAAAVSGGPGALVFSVSEDAWIQVVDAAGRRFSKYLHAGASDSLRGKPPFRLVIGNAAQVKVTYNDQLVDLKPHIGNKVARLTLE